jgi:hypothetical protein
MKIKLAATFILLFFAVRNQVYLQTASWNTATTPYMILSNSTSNAISPLRGGSTTNSNAVRIQTPTGYVDLGPQNAQWCHFSTDRDNYYFNKPLYSANGIFASYYTSDLFLQTGDGSYSSNTRLTILNSNGNVGIGTTTPSQKLEVNGTTKTTNFQVTNGAANGYFLKSDASGNASWTSLSAAETDPQVSSSTTNKVPKWNGTTLADGIITDDGTNVGIGTPTPSQKLEVNGTTKTTNFQMINGAVTGYILKSDASGNASWVSAATTETDPQVSSANTNRVPKWNGTTLTDGMITDDGTRVGVGITATQGKLSVSGDGINTLSLYGDAAGNIGSSGSFSPHYKSGSSFNVYEGDVYSGDLRLKIYAGGQVQPPLHPVLI